jgi:hypothetical protein
MFVFALLLHTPQTEIVIHSTLTAPHLISAKPRVFRANQVITPRLISLTNFLYALTAMGSRQMMAPLCFPVQHETERLRELRRYNILDTPTDDAFDRITIRACARRLSSSTSHGSYQMPPSIRIQLTTHWSAATSDCASMPACR